MDSAPVVVGYEDDDDRMSYSSLSGLMGVCGKDANEFGWVLGWIRYDRMWGLLLGLLLLRGFRMLLVMFCCCCCC